MVVQVSVLVHNSWMTKNTLTVEDCQTRGKLTALIAEFGYAPTSETLADSMGLSVADVDASLQRLQQANALLLHPDSCRPWVVHPFSLAAGPCWVATPDKGYWASCLYCAFGICAATGCDGVITTRLGGEAETVEYTIKDGRVQPSEHVFHLSTPVRHWWDNVVFACSTFQPFRAEVDIDTWCNDHDLPKGETMDIPTLWEFAKDWYGPYLTDPWKKRSPDEIKAIFSKHGFTSDFWSI